MGQRPPPLYRTARAIGWIATIVTIVLVIYLATAVYSATQIRPSGAGNSGSPTSLTGQNQLSVSTTVNFSNPGFFPVNSLSVEMYILLPGGGVFAHGGSPATSIPAQSTRTIPINITVALDFSGPAAALVTHDARLPTDLFVNVTYASLFGAEIRVADNRSWGAPLYGLNLTPGTPVVNGNGTVTVPIQISFDNHADFDVAGTVSFSVRSSGGTTCGTGSLIVSAPSHASFSQPTPVTLAAGCNPHGGAIDGTFSGPTLTFSLPTEPFP